MSVDDHTILDLDIGPVKPGRHWGSSGRGRLVFRLIYVPAKWIVILSLPFYALVRGSVWAYSGLGWGTWSSLGLGLSATVTLFLLYGSWLWKRLTGRKSLPKFLSRALLVVVVGYASYGLLYLNAANAKTPEIREYFTSLHPMLRLGASTFLLFDRGAVITDTKRTVGDYLRMGLPANESSLHFRLEDRWVHALDLRTVGRAEWRNRVTAGYFRLMGFRALRHVGTADHLHISLPISGE
jgi:hypothetical protein